MATSSIFASFDIKDDATLTRFLDALEASEAEQANKPVRPIQMPLTDPEKIRALLSKGYGDLHEV